MVKPMVKFVCQNCGAEFPKWQGQCSECGKWNSLVETVVATRVQSSKFKVQSGEAVKLLKLSDIKSKTFSRINTGIGELDRVLGGGIVPGSLVLVAGEPGIGKSTLLTQLALNLIQLPVPAIKQNPSGDLGFKIYDSRENKRDNTHKSSIINHKSVLYVCGEESPEQIKLRIERLGNGDKGLGVRDNLMFLPETNMENILTSISNQSPTTNHLSLIIVDSIQTMWTANLTGTAGSVGQVRECSNMLLSFAKKTNIPVFLVGHITKEGAIAGPKVLEHLVDTVLYLEGDRQHEFRILRTSKNRFGPTDEVGVFTMSDKGMEEVKDPSRIFLDGGSRKLEVGAGSVITVTMQGIRPMLVEIQALTVPTNLAMPRRVASGISFSKLQVLCAVIQKQLGLPLYQSDVFVNVAGGLKLSEPAVDLAVAMAITSSFRNKSLPPKAVVLGELGLLGEVRKVGFWDKRIKEARKLGFSKIIGEREVNLRQSAQYLK